MKILAEEIVFHGGTVISIFSKENVLCMVDKLKKGISLEETSADTEDYCGHISLLGIAHSHVV